MAATTVRSFGNRLTYDDITKDPSEPTAGDNTPLTHKRQRGDRANERASVEKCGTDCASVGPTSAASGPPRPPQWLMIEDGSVATVAAPQVPEGVD